jgi:putative ABC transport system ATP-binding protein
MPNSKINKFIMLITNQLQFQYSNHRTFTFPNIQCEKGEKLLLLGASGVGKTTLLHLLGGLLRPTHGTLFINGQNLADLKGTPLDRFRGKNVGIIFQQPHFLRALTVTENLILAQQLAGLKADKSLIYNLLEGLNMAHQRDMKTERLSVGEQQRVGIIRALIHRPAVVLADEPTSALDDHNCQEVIRLLNTYASDAALIIVTHDVRLKSDFKNQIVL